MYNYVVSAHKPTSVTHCVTGNFTSPDELNLIVCKCTRIEIFLVTPEGLSPLHDVPIYGRVATMELYRPPGEKQDLLFITTERYNFFVLEYDSRTQQIKTRANGDVQDRIGRPTENGQRAIIDPLCRMIGMHLYEGLFKVVPFDTKYQLKEAFNIRLEELTVIDIQFLYGCAQYGNGASPCPQPTIAVLYQDTKNARHVKTYQVSLQEKEFVDGPFAQGNVDSGASLIIPVPNPYGGVIIIGEETIVYHSGSGTPKAINMNPTTISAYGKIDEDGSRWLLGDHMGNLYVFMLHTDNNSKRVKDISLEKVGETSIPSAISYLDNGVVYIGSSFGDSQLIRLNPDKDETGSFIEVMDYYTNLGPISDFCVVDLEKQGQGQVVTCSGAFKDGSLRIVRNGIGINEQASMDLPGIKGMWSLRPSFDTTAGERYIVLAFIGETRIMGIEENELGETEIPGFDSSSQTILCKNVAGDCWVQVTDKAIRLVDCTTLELVHHWNPPPGMSINVASINPTQIVVATGGGNLVYIEIRDKQLVEVKHVKLEFEISCLDINPLGKDELRSGLCAVGMWTDITLRILKLPTLEQMYREELGGEILPRSVLFASFDDINYLLCGLGDGHLFSFKVDAGTGALNDKKKISLGTQPIHLSTFSSKGETNVFAASDRPTVIYSNNQKKLMYSNVNLKEVNSMCPFNSENFPDSLVFSTENRMMIGTIDEIQKLHIRTVPLGEQPRRICYHESCKSFAVVTLRAQVDENGADTDTYYVKLVDEQTFEIRDEFELEYREAAASIMSCKFAGDNTEYIVVGTAFVFPDESEPSKGRILVMDVRGGKLNLVSETVTKGAVYCMDSFNGKLLTGINSKVILWKWNETEDGTKEFVHECSHHGHILALTVQSRGDFIIVGDLMKSISLLVYRTIDGTIEEIAKDYNIAWISATEILDEDMFIGAENAYNLFTVQRNPDATTEEDRRKLEVVGMFHLGDFVNKFRHGSLVMRLPESESSIANISTLLFGTVNGVIGVVAQIPEELYHFLLKVQTAITQVVSGIGGLSHDNWRAFESERKKAKARNFLDGDLIEMFMDLSPEKKEEIVKRMGGGVKVDDVEKRIEEISRIH